MLKVKIEGLAGEGKTALAAVIAKALRESGYRLVVNDEGIGGPQYPVVTYQIEQYAPAVNDGRRVDVEVVSK